MSVILQPQSSFPIVRQIANHLDSDTLYVRAVVRNADGDTIATVDLEDKGGQRFQRRYRVPVDSSGQGAYISIITSVYTDAGYTSKSPNYGDEENTYLVFDRVLGGRGGGGGGTSVDLKAIRKIMAEEIKKNTPKPIKNEPFPEIPKYEMRWGEILKAIDVLGNDLASIPREQVSLDGVNQALIEIKTEIDEKPVTEETDLQPIIEDLNGLSLLIDERLDSQKELIESTKTELVQTIVDTVKESIETTEFVTDFQVRPRRNPVEKVPEKPEIPQIPLKSLLS